MVDSSSPIAEPSRQSPTARPPRLRSSLIGREAELGKIAQMLASDDVFLLTLTGPGGVGKTRLAIEAGTRAAPLFRDGVVYVALDSTSNADLVCKTIGDALGLGNPGPVSALDQNIAYLRDKQVLLILDSFEHVLDAGPKVVYMLEECERAKVLITSRTRLHLSIEHDIPVQPLSMPASVELFVARARAADPAFSLVAENAGDIAAICARLDGLPLALELAAARVPMFSPAALRARLEPALDLLTVGSRDQPDRHRTMRSAIAWSYDLLEPDEQLLLRQLSVFEQSIPLDIASEVTANPKLLDELLSLIDTSLVQVAGNASDDEPRYRMMHMVREFGLERLAESDEHREVRRRHAHAVLDLVTTSSERIWIAEGTQILSRIDRELGNIRSAMRWTGENGELDIELGLAGAMVNYWVVRGHYVEGIIMLREAIAHAGDYDSPELARLHSGIGWIATLQGNFDLALEHGLRGLELARRHRHLLYEGQALHLMAIVVLDQGDTSAAFSWAAQALTLYRQIEDQVVAGSQYVSSILSMMGGIALAAGDPARASVYLEEELLRQRGWGFSWRLGETLRHIGDVALARGDVDTALARYQESVSLAREHGDRLFLAGSLVAIAMLESDRGRSERAARLLGAAEAISQQVGFSIDRWERARYEAVLDHLRQELPNGAFRDAWDAGAILPFDAVISEALDDPDAPASALSQRSPLDLPELTTRELEVLALLAEGRSDREIGEALSISPRTVSGHVANLLGKLNVSSRTAAAAYAIRLQLGQPPESDPSI